MADIEGTERVRSHREERAEQLQARFQTPVVAAALAAVPATFLTMLDGTAATVGQAVNWASLAVLVAETLVLFFVTDHRMSWLRRNAVVVGLTVVAVPAVIYAVAPAQTLRLLGLLRGFGALRILRVKRIVKAGSILRRRSGLSGRLAKVVTVLLSLLAAAFTALVLADPTSASREVLDAAYARFGPLIVIAAGLVVGVATFVVVRARQEDER